MMMYMYMYTYMNILSLLYTTCTCTGSAQDKNHDDYYRFENQPKKYRLVDADRRIQNRAPDVHFELESTLPSELPAYVQDMMKELVSAHCFVSAKLRLYYVF